MTLAASEVEHPAGAGLHQHPQHSADPLLTEAYPALQSLLFSRKLDCERVGFGFLFSR
jgi:hypothetical protein